MRSGSCNGVGHKGHGIDRGDHVHYGMQTSDGGYIMAGHKLISGTVSDNTDIFDFWLVKVDSN